MLPGRSGLQGWAEPQAVQLDVAFSTGHAPGIGHWDQGDSHGTCTHDTCVPFSQTSFLSIHDIFESSLFIVT